MTKHAITILSALLLAVSATAQEVFKVDKRQAAAPTIRVFQANAKTLRVQIVDGPQKVAIATNETPYFYWALSNTAAQIVTAAVSVVSRSNGTYDATFTADALNYSNGCTGIYGAGILNRPETYGQGAFVITPDPYAAGAGPIIWSTNVSANAVQANLSAHAALTSTAHGGFVASLGGATGAIAIGDGLTLSGGTLTSTGGTGGGVTTAAVIAITAPLYLAQTGGTVTAVGSEYPLTIRGTNGFAVLDNLGGYSGVRYQLAGVDRYTTALNTIGDLVFSRFGAGGAFSNDVFVMRAGGDAKYQGWLAVAHPQPSWATCALDVYGDGLIRSNLTVSGSITLGGVALSAWPNGVVTSVNGATGAVTITAAGLGALTNASAFATAAQGSRADAALTNAAAFDAAGAAAAVAGTIPTSHVAYASTSGGGWPNAWPSSAITNAPWLTSYSETDPVWVGASGSVWSAINGKQAAGSYLTAESDPLWVAASNSVVRTNDSRLTDARTPLAHNQDASTITTGILPMGRLTTSSAPATVSTLYYATDGTNRWTTQDASGFTNTVLTTTARYLASLTNLTVQESTSNSYAGGVLTIRTNYGGATVSASNIVASITGNFWPKSLQITSSNAAPVWGDSYLTATGAVNVALMTNSASFGALSATNTADQTWIVPAGVTQIVVKCWGGGGAGANGVASAAGGYAFSGIVSVTSGETLTVRVGQGGRYGTSSIRSLPGGGLGTSLTGSGGGYSAVLRDSDLIVLAAGGGGGGNSVSGGAGGGSIGANGAGASSGAGGSQTTGAVTYATIITTNSGNYGGFGGGYWSGFGGTLSSSGGGGGGSCWGITPGCVLIRGNNSGDDDWQSPWGAGGASTGNGSDGRVIIKW